MGEWLYVLTVEALIFGLVNMTLVAQRIDVFSWPSDQTWPVLGTSVLTLLAYTLSMIFVFNVIQISSLDGIVQSVSHGLARSSGRLITATVLWVVFQSASVYTFTKRDWPVVLCQLWGTTCKSPGSVFWEISYSVYLSVLLPSLAWFAALQLVVCGTMVSKKITKRIPARRLMNANLVSILVLMSAHAIKESFLLACKDKCPVDPEGFSIFDQQPGRKQVLSMQVLFVAVFFLCTDVVTGTLGAFVHEGHAKPMLFLLVVMYMVQMAALPVIVKVLGVTLQDTIMWVIFGLSCSLGLMDVLEMCAVFVQTRQRRVADNSGVTAPLGGQDMLFAPLPHTALPSAPFSIEKVPRKRLQLSLGGRGMWPYINHTSSNIKKKTT